MLNFQCNKSAALAGKILIITVLYYLGGRFGHYWSLETGYSTIIWPPSGIALAFILLWGYQSWPGVLIGSFLVHAHLSILNETPNYVTLLLPTCIALGAVFQACGGTYLTRRFIGSDNPLIEDKVIIRFFIIAGPISSLINTILGNAALYYFGVINEHNLLTHLVNWWVGDCIGVFIFTPLVLLFFAKPKSVWVSRRTPASTTLIAVFILFIFFETYIKSYEEQLRKNQFEQQSYGLQLSLKDIFHQHIEHLLLLQNLFLNSEYVSRDRFRSFTLYFLNTYPDVNVFKWVPLIKHEQRGNYEQKVIEQGFSGFSIIDNIEGVVQQADERHSYYPVTYIEPLEAHKNVLGYDLGSNNSVLSSMHKARDSGEVVVSNGIKITQKKEDSLGINYVLPVYHQNSLVTVQQRRDFLKGFIVATIQIEKSISHAFAELSHQGIDFQLIDSSVVLHEKLLFSTFDTNTPISDKNENIFQKEFHYAIADKSWLLRFYANTDFFVQEKTIAFWWTLILELLISGLISCGLFILAGRSRYTENLVKKRTEKLNAIFVAYPDLQFVISNEGVFQEYQTTNPSDLFASPKEFLGKKINKILPYEVASQFEGAIAKVLAIKMVVPIEYQLTIAGVNKYFEARIVPLNSEQLFILVRNTTREKTNEKQIKIYTEQLEVVAQQRVNEIRALENQQRETEKLVAAGMVAARVAHEINNPLAGLKNSFLLIKGAIPETHKHFKFVYLIDKEIDRIASIVKQMYSVYKQESKQSQVFKLNRCLTEVLELCESGFKQKNIVCEDKGVDKHIILTLPEDLLRQALLNIIQNAIDNSPINTAISIDAESINNNCIITIVDNGFGISKENMTKIYQPFYTTKNHAKSNNLGMGLGLGLSITMNVIEAMQGTIAIVSNGVGKGTTVILTLPITSPSVLSDFT